MVERGDKENAVETAKFISWSRKSQESSVGVRRGYSSGDDGRESKEFDISLMNWLDVLTGVLQEEGEGGFWEVLGRHVVLIPFEELPSLSSLVQVVIRSPCLFHIHIFKGRERQFDHGQSSHRWWLSLYLVRRLPSSENTCSSSHNASEIGYPFHAA